MISLPSTRRWSSGTPRIPCRMLALLPNAIHSGHHPSTNMISQIPANVTPATTNSRMTIFEMAVHFG